MSKRVALYLRTSTQSQSTDLQRRELLEYVSKRPDWEVVKVYEDQASGANPNRKMLGELMTDCKRRRVDVVCVWKLDRLFRSLRGVVQTLSEWSELGVEFVSLTDNFDMSSSHGRLLANLVACFGEFERDLIRSRVMAGLNLARSRGVKLGRRSNIDPDITQRILEMRNHEKLSYREIAKRLGTQVVSKATVERVCKGMHISQIKVEQKP